MGPHKVPHAFLGACFSFESLLKSAVRLVSGNDKVLLYRSWRCNGLKSTLLLIEYRYIRNDKTCFCKSCLNAIPHRCFRAREFNCHPMARFENAICLSKTIGHEPMVFMRSFALGPVLNSLRLVVRPNLEP